MPRPTLLCWELEAGFERGGRRRGADLACLASCSLPS